SSPTTGTSTSGQRSSPPAFNRSQDMTRYERIVGNISPPIRPATIGESSRAPNDNRPRCHDHENSHGHRSTVGDNGHSVRRNESGIKPISCPSPADAAKPQVYLALPDSFGIPKKSESSGGLKLFRRELTGFRQSRARNRRGFGRELSGVGA